MKYVDTKVVFREVPEEISLAINISGCPVKCPGCHSSYLTQDIGNTLDESALKSLIDESPGISCVSFMGGDADPAFVKGLANWLHSEYPSLKVCWYSGRSLENAESFGMTDVLDFVKVGPYVDEFGPLDSATTNQRFYKIDHTGTSPVLTDWTFRFKKVFV
ncbi:MAG: 4Fe-4S cluster-binding domain-containing protein [Bacteroidales bacterium]|nr:4Fe-4S cluster-binding domain-containing protein [Candidatus Cacconaster merdequi]